jgi:CO/xanthine dehydrogenase FAD-binding subunit
MIGDIRISVGPGGPVPTRAKASEDFLRFKTINDQVIAEAIEILLSEVHLRTSLYRATSVYRQKLAKVLFGDVLKTAWMRAL